MTDAHTSAREHFLQGVRAFEAGRLAAAESAFRASLLALPGRPSTLMNLAATLVRARRPAEALPLLDEALAAEPDSTEALCHRGAALAALGQPGPALAAYDQALRLQPSLVPALFQRAVQLNLLGRPAAALVALEQVMALKTPDGEAWFHHGQTLQALGRADEALRSYDRALALEPGVASTWSRRGTLLKDMGRLPDAARSFQQALTLGGDVDFNRYFLASVSGGEAPQAAPRAYVEQLFDSYAADFDEHLVAQLGYRTPQLLAALLPPGRHFAAALDLGCGTGLMAPLLQPLCGAIDGVDLSNQMLDKARAAGLYRGLHHGDVAEHLHTTGQTYDLVVAADVFVYVGALESVFTGAARVLGPDGCFLFSVEEADAGQSLQLRPSARYAHSQDYVTALAAGHGLAVQQMQRQTLRHDQGRAVAGLLIRLARHNARCPTP
jgi:predicted TPR repeat methyltransferase